MKTESHMSDLRKFMEGAVPFWQTLGLEIKEVAPGKAVFEASVRPGLMQNQMLHGAVLASIADSACSVAAVSRLFPARYATTINLQLFLPEAGHPGALSRRGSMPPGRQECRIL